MSWFSHLLGYRPSLHRGCKHDPVLLAADAKIFACVLSLLQWSSGGIWKHLALLPIPAGTRIFSASSVSFCPDPLKATPPMPILCHLKCRGSWDFLASLGCSCPHLSAVIKFSINCLFPGIKRETSTRAQNTSGNATPSRSPVCLLPVWQTQTHSPKTQGSGFYWVYWIRPWGSQTKCIILFPGYSVLSWSVIFLFGWWSDEEMKRREKNALLL